MCSKAIKRYSNVLKGNQMYPNVLKGNQKVLKCTQNVFKCTQMYSNVLKGNQKVLKCTQRKSKGTQMYSKGYLNVFNRYSSAVKNCKVAGSVAAHFLNWLVQQNQVLLTFSHFCSTKPGSAHIFTFLTVIP